METRPRRDGEAMDRLWQGVDLKEDAIASGDQGTMREAVRTLKGIERRFPRERAVIAKSLLQLSDCFAMAGDAERARRALKRVTHEFSEDDREAAGLAMLGLSRIAAAEGRSVADIGEFWSRGFEALSDPEQRMHARIWYAQVLLQRGDAAGCRERLAQVQNELSVEDSPHLSLWAYDLMGLAYISEGKRAEAERILEQLRGALSGRAPEELLSQSMTEALLRSWNQNPFSRSSPAAQL